MPGHLQALVRDTLFGQIARRLTNGKAFPHPEQQDGFEVPERYRNDHPKRQGSDLGNQKKKRSNGEKAASTPAPRERANSEDTAVEEGNNDNVEEGDQGPHDINLVEWYGEDDEEKPLNWSVGRKIFVLSCLMLITVSVYAGSSIFTPGLEEAMMTWQVGRVPATLGLSLFVIGYAVGPLVLSPLTEIPSIGRNAPYLITLAIYVVLQVPAALINSFSGFLVIRFLQGFFGSPPLATGGASVGDMFGSKTRPYALGAWGLSAAAGPALGPVVSGFAIQAKGWHWHAWIMLWLSGFSLIFLFFTMPENILLRRAKRLRKLTGNENLKSQGEIDQAHMTGKEVATMTLLRPLQLTLTEPIVIALNIYISYVYAVLYSFFESFPLVYAQGGYGWSLGVSQLPFLSLLVGSFIGYAGFCIWNKVYYIPLYTRRNGNLAPEYRLPPAFVGALCYPVCLFWFGWSANRVMWVSPTIAVSFFGIGTVLMFMSVLNYLPDAYPEYAASVLASNDFTRSMIGGACPLFASIMYQNIGIDWGSSVLGFFSLAMIPIPFVLFKFGHRIRNRSKMAVHD